MSALLTFPLVAAWLVWGAGRRDPARDPRLTTAALAALAALPVLLALPLPGLLPAVPAAAGHGAAGGGAVVWLGWVWACGAAVALARLAAASGAIGRARRRSVLLGRHGRVELRVCGEFGGPVAAGAIRPVVFVPPAWHGWDAATRRAVLLHELAHHARRDPLRRWVAAVACAIHWWNPLVRWMARRLHEQCEFACDARVVAAGVRVERYAGLLCDLAAAGAAPHAAVGLAEGSTLERRIRRLAQGPRPGWSGALVAVLVAAILASGIGLALLRPARPPRVPQAPAVPRSEVELRLSADPFPAE